jgi:LPXTG-site transpeptidase (sortase) family protein
MHPIRRSRSIFDLPAKELFRLAIQGVGFCALVYLALAVFGFLPRGLSFFESTGTAPEIEAEDIGGESYELPEAPEAEVPSTWTIPGRVSIPSIGVDAEIRVPVSIDVATLDALLSRGAVYYPGSGAIEGGNIFVFGHSTNWPIVQNQAYKTFNNLDDLEAGDRIYLSGEGWQAAYEVESVRIAPDSEVLVSFGGSARRLTLSTCNTFGLKEERIVVEARAIGDIDYSL